MTTLVITGVDGFVGAHLVEAAVAHGLSPIGIGRSEALRPSLREQLQQYFAVDLRQTWPLTQPVDAIVHLAGLSALGQSFGEPQRYIEANSAMVTTMCEALLEQRATTRVVGVSTGALYAQPLSGTPIDELSEVYPASPYAVSKLLVEHQLAYYRLRGVDTVVARPFNHVGGGQRAGFLLPDLVNRLRRLRDGEALRVGNLDNARDYSHVKDVSEAYLALATERELRHTLYNVASGVATTGNQILGRICQEMGRDVPPLQVDQELMRPGDPKVIVGSAQRLTSDTGWKPTHTLQDAITDVVRAAEAA